MKKIKANTVLSAFIFGVSILLLCSFGTDSAYIILSRYKLQKIANAAALEYAASLGRNARYADGSESDCSKVKNELERIYSSIGSGTLGLKLEYMGEKTNVDNKESVVKVSVSSKVLPAFLRFVGAKQIIIHANSYAKTNVIEITKQLTPIDTPADYRDIEDSTYTIFSAPFIQGSKKAELVTSKSDLNGDFAIDFGYFITTSEDNPDAGGGFFIFAGYDTKDGVRWADIGRQVKKENDSDPNPWTKITSPSGSYYYCVNASDSTGRPKTVTFELTQQETPPTLAYVSRFNRLKIYKAGGIHGTTLNDGSIVSNPCDPNLLTKVSAPVSYAAKLAEAESVLPSIGGDTYAGSSSGDGGSTGGSGGAGDLPSIGGDVESGSTSTEVIPPNIFNTPAKVKFTIMNNISLISAKEYKDFSGTEGICPLH